jgi:redox-sensing transcriptional repressor
MSDKIPQAVIRRLPKYYRYLEEVQARGEDKISSHKMSSEMGLNASQIRRDLNCFGGFGQQGYGYSVAKLKGEIAHILGLDRTYKVIIVGAGRIGQALMGYTNFIKEGFNIVDIFDADPNKVGMTVEYKSVRHTSDLQEYLSRHAVDIAFICTPKESAQAIADQLVSLGLRAVWNFAPVDVCVRKGVSVENVHLSDSLYVLAYSLNKNQ